MCSKRLWDWERNAGASRPFKTEPRSSGRSFVILGGSAKLDAGVVGSRAVSRRLADLRKKFESSMFSDQSVSSRSIGRSADQQPAASRQVAAW
ncbi:hypothetical protein MRB53_023509 [Persea americana]|uniref:Uncharacterized protein n=1 Tax=Persea americana TaxID=3435 RepID=A0ACC2LAF4_PERAE|nr:hypothetical protein MRB53_023509 [Persea americana]